MYRRLSEKTFQFFIRGTLLQQLALEYADIKELLETMKISIRKKQEIIPDIKRNVLDAQKKVQDLSHLAKMKEETEQLRKEQVWALVAESERVLIMRMPGSRKLLI
jgi:ATP-dependent protease HslVU (ClpYQ) peptidase subunit